MLEIEGGARFRWRMLVGLWRRLHGLVNGVQGSLQNNGVERVTGYGLADLPVTGRQGGSIAWCCQRARVRWLRFYR